MECAGENKVVICIDILQALVEFPLIDQTSSFIDYYQREDDPVDANVSIQKLLSVGCKLGLTFFFRLWA